ncbi:MAG: DJ-1/PfpI family protein [Clostridia bacterium]|nr:DJ-1/PfpI family protein [Clostridia bacterium]
MVYLFLAEGFEEVEALTPLDFLRRAGVEVTTVCVGDNPDKIATGSHKIPVLCDISEGDVDKSAPFDMIILPGGLPGADNLNASLVVSHFIDRAVKEDKYICAICAAPYILGQRGILKGRKACCYPGFEGKLTGATISQNGVVRDGKIITSRAMGKAVDFSLEIIDALCGNEMKEKLRTSVLYDKGDLL